MAVLKRTADGGYRKRKKAAAASESIAKTEEIKVTNEVGSGSHRIVYQNRNGENRSRVVV
mgnify:CR=1 FL=1